MTAPEISTALLVLLTPTFDNFHFGNRCSFCELISAEVQAPNYVAVVPSSKLEIRPDSRPADVGESAAAGGAGFSTWATVFFNARFAKGLEISRKERGMPES